MNEPFSYIEDTTPNIKVLSFGSVVLQSLLCSHNILHSVCFVFIGFFGLFDIPSRLYMYVMLNQPIVTNRWTLHSLAESGLVCTFDHVFQ